MKPEAEPDRVDARFVLSIGLVALAITGLACLVAWGVLRCSASVASLERVHRVRVEPPRATVSDLENDLFADEQKRTLSRQKQVRARLHSFGWSQREHGLIHVPIERAFDLYLAGARVADSAEPPETKP